MKFTVTEGDHLLPCPKCDSSTQVRVYLEGGALRIKSTGTTSATRPKTDP